jgi:hypothetical protein
MLDHQLVVAEHPLEHIRADIEVPDGGEKKWDIEAAHIRT